MVKIDFTLSADKADVTIVLPPGSNILRMDATSLDKVIHQLGKLRAEMPLAIPETRPSFGVGDGIRQPTFGLYVDDFNLDPVLQVRDPRFGWLNYIIATGGARKLSLALDLLAQKAEAAKLAQVRPKAAH